jgi:galactokinase/mevalonate kinase-like predicted kinase
MRFLNRGFPHISIAPGGFKDCIKYISSDQIEYVQDEDIEEDNKSDWSLEELKKLANQVDTTAIKNKVKTFGTSLKLIMQLLNRF